MAGLSLDGFLMRVVDVYRRVASQTGLMTDAVLRGQELAACPVDVTMTEVDSDRDEEADVPVSAADELTALSRSCIPQT